MGSRKSSKKCVRRGHIFIKGEYKKKKQKCVRGGHIFHEDRKP